MKMKLGKMVMQVLQSVFKKPATLNYPAEKPAAFERFRGEIKFDPSKCIGCKICVKDCPSGAIEIKKIGEKEFELSIDLAKCIYCGQCADSCPKKAIALTNAFELAQLNKENLKVTFRAESPDEPERNPLEDD